MSNTHLIYVRLLDEGTEVYRPVRAFRLANGMFQIEHEQDYDRDDERWEFEPGEEVLCTRRELSGQRVLIASARDDSGPRSS